MVTEPLTGPFLQIISKMALLQNIWNGGHKQNEVTSLVFIEQAWHVIAYFLT